jgi:hypothetical protein
MVQKSWNELRRLVQLNGNLLVFPGWGMFAALFSPPAPLL